MKMNIKKRILWSISFFAFLLTSSLLQSCKEDEAMKWVDLRYRVEDSYLVEAKAPETITFKVKSTDPWVVFGKSDWYTISPDQGEPGETYTVTITCKENTNLDDRIDTLIIKSDYWIGKRFTVMQRGIAYLTVADTDFLLNKDEDQKSFKVLSNQKWTAKITDGDSWLSIVSGESGEINGEVKVKSSVNTGEQRTGKVTIYDRHGVACQVVNCIQDGVMLMPAIPENGKWFVTYEQAQTLEIPVEANSEWTASKENEDDDWFTIRKTSFNGSDKLLIDLSEHKGAQVRTGIITLSSKAEDGATPVVKQIKFKQANPQTPVVTEVNQTINGTYYGAKKLAPGLYNIYLGPVSATEFQMFVLWGDYELRYWIINGVTDLSTRPWCADVFSERGDCRKPVDTAKSNVLSINISESVDEKGQSWIYTEWILNHSSIVSAISDGFDKNGYSDTWKAPWSVAKDGGTLYIKTNGPAQLIKYEYIAPLVWGD